MLNEKVVKEIQKIMFIFYTPLKWPFYVYFKCMRSEYRSIICKLCTVKQYDNFWIFSLKIRMKMQLDILTTRTRFFRIFILVELNEGVCVRQKPGCGSVSGYSDRIQNRILSVYNQYKIKLVLNINLLKKIEPGLFFI